MLIAQLDIKMSGHSRRWGSWLISRLTRGHNDNNGYNQIPVAEAGSRGHLDPAEPWPTSMLEPRSSFLRTLRQILTYSWSNIILVCVPIGYITYLAGAYTPIVFTSNALAVIPLSNLLTLATECIARDIGDSIGAIMNISFGNLIEMIILSVLEIQ
jgi:hypothetical protein